MLNRPAPFLRRHTAVLTLAMAGTATLAYAAQTATPDSSAPLVHLKGALIYQDGDLVRRSTLDFVGRSGEPTQLVIGAAQTETPNVSIHLVPTALDDKNVQVEMRFEGLPPGIQADQPRMVLNWGSPGTLESIDAKTVRRLTVFLVGTREQAAQPGTR